MLSLEEARSEAEAKRATAAREARDAAVASTEQFVQREVEQRQELEGEIRQVRRETHGNFSHKTMNIPVSSPYVEPLN